MIPALVSTVIPVRNRSALLRDAIGSVLAQDWRPIEIVVVDDGSTDETLQVARTFEAAQPEMVSIVCQANAGPGAARQAGSAAARGEFLQFLDSDDRLLPGKFTAQVAALRADSAAGIAYGKTYVVHEDGSRTAEPRQVLRQIFPALLKGRLWQTATPLYRRSALDAVGPWPSKRQMEDWEFDAQAGAAGIELAFCDVFVAEYHLHTGERLAHAWQTDPNAMRDMLSAYSQILRCARQAGVADGTPEMQRFARTLFRAARLAGTRGFTAEAAELLLAVHSIGGKRPSAALDVFIYSWVAKVLGWKVARWLGT